MKNIKLKYFAFALMMLLQWSCAKTDIPEASETISKSDLFGEGSMLNDYKIFKIDGVATGDFKEIDKMMKGAHVVFYNPEIKEVDFYSSEASYRKFNPEIEQDVKVTESVQATAATTYADTFTDIGDYGTDVNGVSGLGTILDQGYFRNYARNIFFINTNTRANSKNFIRLQDSNNFNYLVAGVTISSTGSVSRYDYSMTQVFSNITSGITKCIIKNDTDNNRNLYFYKNVNHVSTEPRVLIKLSKNSIVNVSSTFLSSIGGTCKSFQSVTY
jgi:hypothetical protein